MLGKKPPPTYHMIYEQEFFYLLTESRENIHGSFKKTQWGKEAGTKY